MTIILPSSIPVGTQYWKYHTPEGWIDVTSLLADNDGDNVLTLILKDGGLGDDDGTTNGMIVDQGGPGIIPRPVGGVLVSVNKFVILTPYLALAGFAGAVSTIFAIRRGRKV